MAIDLTQIGAPGANGLSILSGYIDPPADQGAIGELWLNYATKTMFKKFIVEGWRPILYLKSKPGVQGKSGAYPVQASINGLGHLEITMSNGNVLNAGGAIGGPQGADAWSPVMGITADGARRVLTVVSWIGGEGPPPSATPIYVGTSGLTNILANGVDVRGSSGAGTGDVIGPSTSNIGTIAVYGNTSGDLIREPTSAELTALKNSLGITNPPNPGLVLLSVQTASASLVLNFTGLSTYKAYQVIGRNLRPSEDSEHFTIRFSTNNGSTYFSSDYQWSRIFISSNGNFIASKATSSPDTLFGTIANGAGPGVGQGLDFTAWIGDLTQGTRPKTVTSSFISFNADNELISGNYYVSHETADAAVNAIRFGFRVGTIQSGTIALYGARPTV